MHVSRPERPRVRNFALRSFDTLRRTRPIQPFPQPRSQRIFMSQRAICIKFWRNTGARLGASCWSVGLSAAPWNSRPAAAEYAFPKLRSAGVSMTSRTLVDAFVDISIDHHGNLQLIRSRSSHCRHSQRWFVLELTNAATLVTARIPSSGPGWCCRTIIIMKSARRSRG